MKYAAAIVTSMLLLAGCQKESPQSQEGAAAESAANVIEPQAGPMDEAITAPADARSIELPVGEGGAEPMAVFGGQSITGQLIGLDPNQIMAIGVRVGNYMNKSDGSFEMKACVDSTCQVATVPLQGSKDNGYLIFNFPEALTVATGQTLDFTLSRSQSANGAAIWTYPLLAGQGSIKSAKGTDTERMPKVALYVKQ